MRPHLQRVGWGWGFTYFREVYMQLHAEILIMAGDCLVCRTYNQDTMLLERQIRIKVMSRWLRHAIGDHGFSLEYMAVLS